MAVKTSAAGRQFISREEGCPRTVYLDVGGVATVGPGLSNKSAVVIRMLGRLKRGTQFTQAQLDQVFAAVLAEETEPAVRRGLPNCSQQEFDGAASGTYNLGPAYPTWQWAKLWRQGKKHAAFDYVRTHYNTVRGKRVTGLVHRREREADLMESGVYGSGIIAPEGVPREATDSPPVEQPTTGDPVVREAQSILAKRGFDPGEIDGWMGPKTKAAVLAYQRAHPDLVADGIVGPATLAQLRRDAMTTRETAQKVMGSGAVSAVGSYSAGLRWDIIAAVVGVVVVLALIYMAWRYRDILKRRWNRLLGREQEV